MINDRPTNITLNAIPTSTKGASAPKAAEINDKEQVESQPETAKVAQPQTPEAKETESSTKQVSDMVEAQARREELKQRVNDAIPKVRELMNKNQRSLDFKVAEEENRVIVTVIDKETDQIIRQIPPEDLLQIADSIEQGVNALKEGSFINSKA